MQDTMSNLAETTDFWRPPLERLEPSTIGSSHPKLMCSRCDSEFVFGSRFCHVCGADRYAKPASRNFHFASLFSWANRLTFAWPQVLGMNPATLVSFFLGVACMVSAVLTGVVAYQPHTTFDWQAVQIWRIEWMLGGIGAFLAGILLRKPE